uniref:Uncharacterized protein n=1 Tax=Taeniopygia guttata TaxID=59729 RepID=A0A674HB00_TAEGU
MDPLPGWERFGISSQGNGFNPCWDLGSHPCWHLGSHSHWDLGSHPCWDLGSHSPWNLGSHPKAIPRADPRERAQVGSGIIQLDPIPRSPPGIPGAAG